MDNNQYPFNRKEHVFDFKVKVNFENGNVSLTAPQIVTPPAYFGNQSSYQPNHNVYTAPSLYNNPYSNGAIQSSPIISNYTPIESQLPKPPTYQSSTNSSPSMNYPYVPLPPQPISNQKQIPQTSPMPRNQPIQLVNSSYTSMHNQSSDYSQMINNSMQIIQCVLCQKSFNANEFDQHLELHRNKNNRTQISTTNQKNNASHYAMTQNSFNANNDSIASGEKHNNSRHNDSFSSSGSQHHSMKNDSGFVPNFVHVNPSINQQNNNSTNNHNHHHQQSLNESSQLLGRIDNPILAINAQQQVNMSLTLSSHHQSLSYSNSQNQSLQRYNDPTHVQSIQQSPNFNQVNNSNGSSFGHNGGNNFIGPSFYHNSSQESSNNIKNGPFVKGINRLTYNDANNSMGSNHSSNHGEINPNVMVPNVFLPNNNQSYHSHHSGQQHSSYGSNGSNHFHNYSHQSQQYINAQMMNNSPMMNNSQQQQYQAHNNSNGMRNSHNSSLQQPSFHSNHSLQNNFITSQQNMLQSNNMMGNFQTIESRYLNQQTTNSRQLYASQQDLNPIRQQGNGSRRHEEGLFNENDISSISGSSRRDMSEYSDWSEFNRKQDEKQHGYNSADNSIIKHMQTKKQQQQTLNQNQKNVYLDRSESRQKNADQGFTKKKKDHMIASSASYYERKFKDEDYSSSDDQQFVNRTGRLSYAERLKQKRVTDNSRPLELSNTKSGRGSNNLKQSAKSINSEDSSLSKTKLPVNYLAREQFISTSSTSKSTHKTNLPS